MWYLRGEEKNEEINYSRPIVAECGKINIKYLLLPQLGNSYSVKGYNWFNIKTGEYNSCACYKTAKQAVEAYSDHSVYNVNIVLNP